eukprot:11561542-Karenia_brevis.AAC.1
MGREDVDALAGHPYFKHFAAAGWAELELHSNQSIFRMADMLSTAHARVPVGQFKAMQIAT